MPEFPLHGVADLKENEKKLVSAGKAKILVLRHQGKLSAFQSNCPHAGGPLEKGAICNGRLVCPWHMGTFRIPDGQLIEPPAMDSLETYPYESKAQASSLHSQLRRSSAPLRSRRQ
jgi:apoptosis-inducing factor 3